jgi:hypothetical protein
VRWALTLALVVGGAIFALKFGAARTTSEFGLKVGVTLAGTVLQKAFDVASVLPTNLGATWISWALRAGRATTDSNLARKVSVRRC